MEELFQSIGLSESKARDTMRNTTVSNNLKTYILQVFTCTCGRTGRCPYMCMYNMYTCMYMYTYDLLLFLCSLLVRSWCSTCRFGQVMWLRNPSRAKCVLVAVHELYSCPTSTDVACSTTLSLSGIYMFMLKRLVYTCTYIRPGPNKSPVFCPRLASLQIEVRVFCHAFQGKVVCVLLSLGLYDQCCSRVLMLLL